MTGWWFGTFGLFFPSYWEFHHPNGRTPWFFRGVGLNHQPDDIVVSTAWLRKPGWRQFSGRGYESSSENDDFSPVLAEKDTEQLLGYQGRWWATNTYENLWWLGGDLVDCPGYSWSVSSEPLPYYSGSQPANFRKLTKVDQQVHVEILGLNLGWTGQKTPWTLCRFSDGDGNAENWRSSYLLISIDFRTILHFKVSHVHPTS